MPILTSRYAPTRAARMRSVTDLPVPGLADIFAGFTLMPIISLRRSFACAAEHPKHRRGADVHHRLRVRCRLVPSTAAEYRPAKVKRPSTLLQWVPMNDSACKTLYSVTARSGGPGKTPDGSRAPAKAKIDFLLIFFQSWRL